MGNKINKEGMRINEKMLTKYAGVLACFHEKRLDY